MRTLSRYFVKRYLSFFVAILFFCSLALAIIEMALGFESVQGFQELIRWTLIRLPSYYLGDLAPLSAYLATLFSLGLAARWLEWGAIQAAGIAPWRVLAPIIVSALCLAVVTATIRESLVPLVFDSQQATRRPISEQLANCSLIGLRVACWESKTRGTRLSRMVAVTTAKQRAETMIGASTLQGAIPAA